MAGEEAVITKVCTLCSRKMVKTKKGYIICRKCDAP